MEVVSANGNGALQAATNAQARLQKILAASREAHRIAKRYREDTESELIIIATASCRSLCEQVLASLPREVRDMVYDRIIDNPSFTVRFGEVRDAPGWKCGRILPLVLTQRGVPTYTRDEEFSAIGHWWIVDHVGDEFLRELVEAWYRTTTFNFGYHYDQIRTFIEANALELPIVPGQVFTKMAVSVDVSDLEKQIRQDCIDWDPGALCLHCLFNNLKLLTHVKRRLHITIEVSFGRRHYDFLAGDTPRALVALLKPLHGSLSPLQLSGHSIEVLDKNGIIPSSLYNVNPFPDAWVPWLKKPWEIERFSSKHLLPRSTSTPSISEDEDEEDEIELSDDEEDDDEDIETSGQNLSP